MSGDRCRDRGWRRRICRCKRGDRRLRNSCRRHVANSCSRRTGRRCCRLCWTRNLQAQYANFAPSQIRSGIESGLWGEVYGLPFSVTVTVHHRAHSVRSAALSSARPPPPPRPTSPRTRFAPTLCHSATWASPPLRSGPSFRLRLPDAAPPVTGPHITIVAGVFVHVHRAPHPVGSDRPVPLTTPIVVAPLNSSITTMTVQQLHRSADSLRISQVLARLVALGNL